jgi:signal peptidase II
VLFILVPVVAMVGIAIYAWKSDEFSPLQRWFVAGVLGGGVGNIIDRIFRPAGVVDFLDVKFYGLFGLERWPTFNVADSSVVVCGILLVLSMFIERSET